MSIIVVLKVLKLCENVLEIIKNIQIIKDNSNNSPIILIMHIILLLSQLSSRAPGPTPVITHYLTIMSLLQALLNYIFLLNWDTLFRYYLSPGLHLRISRTTMTTIRTIYGMYCTHCNKHCTHCNLTDSLFSAIVISIVNHCSLYFIHCSHCSHCSHC